MWEANVKAKQSQCPAPPPSLHLLLLQLAIFPSPILFVYLDFCLLFNTRVRPLSIPSLPQEKKTELQRPQKIIYETVVVTLLRVLEPPLFLLPLLLLLLFCLLRERIRKKTVRRSYEGSRGPHMFSRRYKVIFNVTNRGDVVKFCVAFAVLSEVHVCAKL